jgi:hypothetical protein
MKEWEVRVEIDDIKGSSTKDSATVVNHTRESSRITTMMVQ